MQIFTNSKIATLSWDTRYNNCIRMLLESLCMYMTCTRHVFILVYTCICHIMYELITIFVTNYNNPQQSTSCWLVNRMSEYSELCVVGNCELDLKTFVFLTLSLPQITSSLSTLARSLLNCKQLKLLTEYQNPCVTK